MNSMAKPYRKYMKGFILVLIVVFALTGCLGEEDYQAYKDAAVKTDAIQKGAEALSVTFNQTFFPNEDRADDPKMQNGLERIQFNLSGQSDLETDQAFYDIYLYYNDLGNDFTYVRKSETEQYIKIPIFKDYLKLSKEINDDQAINEATNEATDNVINNASMESANMKSMDMDNFNIIIDEIGAEWQAMIQKENIFVGEKTTIKNEDGNVKATKFTIKPTTEQLILISGKIKERLLAHSSEIATVLNQSAIQNIFADKDSFNNDAKVFDSDQVRKLIEHLMTNMTITHYEEVAYVDLDGYIIDETTTIGIEYTQSDEFKTSIKAQEIVINSKHWDIGQAQKFNFPVIDETNSKSMDTFDFGTDLKK